MSKRFTDTDIWKKPWFRALRPQEKIAWKYITDQCDNVGVWEADTELADFMIGEPIDWQGFRERCNGNIEILPNGKWWLVDFVDFQYGNLRGDVNDKARQSYVRLLDKHGLLGVYKGHTRGLEAHKDKDKDKDKEKEKDKSGFQSDADTVIAYLNKKTGRSFKAIDSNRKGIIARLNDGYSVEDAKHVIDVKCDEWLGTDYEKHLNCETLFRPSKFDKYLQTQRQVDVDQVVVSKPDPEIGTEQFEILKGRLNATG